MTPRRAVTVAILLACLGAGVVLRLHRWREAPPGPWIDETLALRAARVATHEAAPLLGTSPLQPPDAGFVNFWVTNPVLAAISALDRLAGGGIASVRAMSLAPSLVLLFAAAGLAARAAAGRLLPCLAACALLSTSSWLLSTGRWGWIAVGTSALVVLAAWAALRAAALSSRGWGAVAGALLGSSVWGYVAAWALVPLPFLLLLDAWRRRRARESGRQDISVAAAGLAAFLAVVAPLAFHYAAHPDRALARTRELSATRTGANGALAALGRNVVGYAKLFTVGGDPNERHGDPARPVLPVAVSGLALVAVAEGIRRSGAARLLAAVAGLFLLAGLLAAEESANAFRTSLAAPPLIVLAALGAERLVAAVGAPRRRLATGIVAVVVAVAALSDASGFLRWLSSPRLYGAFGGPERDLADAVAAQISAGGPADVVLAPGAARNAFVVDALLAGPRSVGPAIRQAAGPGAFRYVPSRDVLFADAATGVAPGVARSLGASEIASGGRLPGLSGWTLWRMPASRAAHGAREHLARFPLIPARGTGRLAVPEEGLYTFSSRGGVDVALDGRVVFDRTRPAGALTARLGAGRHELEVRPLAPGAVLRVVGPDGFVLPSP